MNLFCRKPVGGCSIWYDVKREYMASIQWVETKVTMAPNMVHRWTRATSPRRGIVIRLVCDEMYIETCEMGM